MEITKKALRRIERLRMRQRKPMRTGIRLGFHDGKAFIKWETRKPRGNDVVLMESDVPVVVDKTAYARIQSCTLDFIAGRSANPHFCLRHAGRHQAPYT